MVGAQGSKFKTTIPAETPIRINVGEADKINYLHRRAVDSSSSTGRSHKERNSFILELIYTLSDPALAQPRPVLCLFPRPPFPLIARA